MKSVLVRGEVLDLCLVPLLHPLSLSSVFLPDVFNYILITHFVFILASRNKASVMILRLCVLIIVTRWEAHLVRHATRLIFSLMFIVLRITFEPQFTVCTLLPIVCTMRRARR
jgi:hypothetical protein